MAACSRRACSWLDQWTDHPLKNQPLEHRPQVARAMDGQRRRGRPTRRHPSTTTSASTTLIAAAAAAGALLLSILGAAHAFQPPPPPPSLSSPPPLIPTARVPWPLHAAGAAGAGPADSTAAAAAVRERLVDGEREGTLVVSTGRFPLIGLPAWSLPLHVGVLLSVEEKRKARKGRDGTCLWALGSGSGWMGCGVLGMMAGKRQQSPNRQTRPIDAARIHTHIYTHTEPGGGYFLYDFVPAEPTAPSTAVKLFSGGRVPGLVREKVGLR